MSSYNAIIVCSDDGIYLASGTISGSVSVYISFSLQVFFCSFITVHIFDRLVTINVTGIFA